MSEKPRPLFELGSGAYYITLPLTIMAINA